MTKEKRDDRNLHSLICPFCQMTNDLESPDLGPVLAIKGCKLVGLPCKYCGKYMDEKAIDNTHREYFIDDELGLSEMSLDTQDDFDDDNFDDDNFDDDLEDEPQ